MGNFENLLTSSSEFSFIALLLIAFAAATILPFSSEAALTAAILSGMSPFIALTAASIGNCLACLFNYMLGIFFADYFERKLQRSKSGKKAQKLLGKYGILSLFLSWLPIIGDPLTIAAGIIRVPLKYFIPVVCLLRIGRYYIVIMFFL